MDKQKVYDTIRDHLLSQNKKSFTIDEMKLETCMYRGPDGLKCAIGCLIPDEKYDKYIEGKPVYDSSVVDMLPLWAKPSDNEGEQFLLEIQQIHDSYCVETWKNRLLAFAKKHGLKD